ncbi:MAG: enoyl-CoA hydratase-related protein [Aeromicrobium sp.]|uniref:enoyl-CoA hydratase-related protein n=1 Tax=Aeromicrobium sp. TaxID=1871063 RepID=UPI00261C6ADC|nr:enoyl-CoA hydratase-related protein [Aeromicrobium sp.]MDF1704222.1 enoyl-CoA hydratase-related protein [Aeromicrobium sp.]
MTDLTPGTRSGDSIGWAVDHGVLTLWLRRATTLNAIDGAMLEDLADVVEQATDHGASVIALRAEGRGFCSGADIGGDPTADDGPAKTDTIVAGERLVRAMTTSPLPVVSAVHGPCAGIGVPLALAADLTLASDQAFFMLAFTRIGLMPDGGATALVAAAVGRATAMRMALLAERITAADAAAQGLIASVSRADTFDAHVNDVLARLAAGPSVAYALTKQAVNDATLASLDHAFQVELEGQAGLLVAADFVEGTTAFREKRAAVFTDR